MQKVTRVGVVGIPAVPAPVAKGTRTKRGEEQRNIMKKMTKEGKERGPVGTTQSPEQEGKA